MVKPTQRVQSRSNRKKVISSHKTSSNHGLAISSQRYSTIPTPVNAGAGGKNSATPKISGNAASNRTRVGQAANMTPKLS